MRWLAAYPKQNALAKTLREIGRLERTSSPSTRSATRSCGGEQTRASTRVRRATPSLGPCSFIALAKSITAPSKINATAPRASISSSPLSSFGTRFISATPAELRSSGEQVRDDLLAHIAPFGWEHITFNRGYVWPTEPLQNAFRPLRNPRAEHLEVAWRTILGKFCADPNRLTIRYGEGSRQARPRRRTAALFQPPKRIIRQTSEVIPRHPIGVVPSGRLDPRPACRHT